MEKYSVDTTDDPEETTTWEDFEDFDIEDYMEEDDLTKDLDFNTDEEYRGDPEDEDQD